MHLAPLLRGRACKTSDHRPALFPRSPAQGMSRKAGFAAVVNFENAMRSPRPRALPPPQRSTLQTRQREKPVLLSKMSDAFLSQKLKQQGIGNTVMGKTHFLPHPATVCVTAAWVLSHSRRTHSRTAAFQTSRTMNDYHVRDS